MGSGWVGGMGVCVVVVEWGSVSSSRGARGYAGRQRQFAEFHCMGMCGGENVADVKIRVCPARTHAHTDTHTAERRVPAAAASPLCQQLCHAHGVEGLVPKVHLSVEPLAKGGQQALHGGGAANEKNACEKNGTETNGSREKTRQARERRKCKGKTIEQAKEGTRGTDSARTW